MSNEKIRVTGAIYGKVGFYEQHADHPDGQAWVVGGEISEIALTSAARRALSDGRLKRVSNKESAETFTPLQIALQKVANVPTNSPAWYMAMADVQFVKGNKNLGLVMRGRAGMNPDVPADEKLTLLYQELARLSPDHDEYRYVVEQILEREHEIAEETHANKAKSAANQTESKPDDQTSDESPPVENKADEPASTVTIGEGAGVEPSVPDEQPTTEQAEPKKPSKKATKAD